MKGRVRWFDSLFILIFSYLFVLQIQAIWPFTIDDMFISLRYAKNWAAGDGLLWNINSPPVEGYSNFSFVVLGTISILFHIDPVISLKVAGLIGLFFTCFFIYLISRFWFDWRQSLLPCMALLFYKGQIIWAVSGFETTVYQALLCGTVYFSFRGLGYHFFPNTRGTPRVLSFLGAGFLLSLAGLTRPEAPSLMAVFFILLYCDRPKAEKTAYWQGMFLFVLMLLLIFAPYFLWRWHYYGFLFPNSIYCKGFANTSMLLDINYLKLIWPFALLALYAWTKKRNDIRYYFLGLPSVLYLIMLMGADPIVAFDNRLFLPAFVLLLPLAWKGISEILLLYLKQRDQFFTLSLFIVTFCIAFFLIPMMTLADYRYFKNNPLEGEKLRGSVVQWLNTHTKQGDTVVIADAGYVPYKSNLKFIDSYCLNNVSMTKYPKAYMYEQFCHDILKEKPDIVILTSLLKQGQVIYTPSDVCLKQLLEGGNKYKLSKTISTDNQDSSYRYELFTMVY
ncbi:hypothetical protein [Legionella fallonii]|uniref:LphB n=1 Tax=Legionella fallonii LLAP-10 TaxID=1212491 RepID=A0A098G5Q1_9GAMM|nr:hypothetical protein [Legionella fallonii]CEG57301.1 conserved membrane protein of unknown function [Legionella fallonii LLAP-10]